MNEAVKDQMKGLEEHRIGATFEAKTDINMRILFLECAVTVLVQELVARGILPRLDAEEDIIERAESLMGTGDRSKGRGELVAAFVHPAQPSGGSSEAE